MLDQYREITLQRYEAEAACRECESVRDPVRRRATKDEIYEDVQPELVLKENDMGQWIIDRIYGDDVHSFTFEDADSASAMLDTMKRLYGGMGSPPRFEETDEESESANYLRGYEDGYKGVQNSLLWSTSESYKLGWIDGDGDKLYGVERGDDDTST